MLSRNDWLCLFVGATPDLCRAIKSQRMGGTVALLRWQPGHQSSGQAFNRRREGAGHKPGFVLFKWRCGYESWSGLS